MDFNALARVLGRDPGKPEEPDPGAAPRPQEAPATLDPGNPTGEPPPSGPTFTRRQLRAVAGPDWPEIANRPEALRALADLLRTRATRARGERPAHYVEPVQCATCGAVWLWAGVPGPVLACPWCLDPPPAALIPRPTPEDYANV